MVLCGEGSPVTLNLDFEHHQFLNRLEQLRYVTNDGRSGVAVPNRIRENAMVEMGMDVGRIFAKLNTLLAEEWRVMGDTQTEEEADDPQLVELRIVLSCSELSLIPFEMAIAPQAYPGEGLKWALQHQLPIVPIREIHRNRVAPVSWGRPLEPKILLISAAPGDLEVPLAPHVQALREALEPWIQWPMKRAGQGTLKTNSDQELQRLPFVKERLRLLSNASIDDIYALCAREQFTHIHILAHGAEVEIGGEKRHGLALCDHSNRSRISVISGQRLAKALQAESEHGTRRSQPLLVTLAACDSGNPNSVLIPGGSIAHDLHAAGIPWVLASQLPLTKVGSVRLTKKLYKRILRGDDPRKVLFEVRRHLYLKSERDHDWASIVAYATIPPDFDDQIVSFFERQMRRAIDITLSHADYLVDHADHNVDDELKNAFDAVIDRLNFWKGRLPKGKGFKDIERRAECFGMYGSTWKRIALLHYKKEDYEQGRADLKMAIRWYRKAIEQGAMKESRYHWVITQILSLNAVLNSPKDPETWITARIFAQLDIEKSKGSTKAWAHGTMAELLLLAKYHIPERKVTNIKKQVQEHCNAIVQLMGEDSFEVYSTRRQFQRYLEYWDKDDWRPLAEAAIKALSPSGIKGQSELPSYG
jgi:hypothetical protein